MHYVRFRLVNIPRLNSPATWSLIQGRPCTRCDRLSGAPIVEEDSELVEWLREGVCRSQKTCKRARYSENLERADRISVEGDEDDNGNTSICCLLLNLIVALHDQRLIDQHLCKCVLVYYWVSEWVSERLTYGNWKREWERESTRDSRSIVEGIKSISQPAPATWLTADWLAG